MAFSPETYALIKAQGGGGGGGAGLPSVTGADNGKVLSVVNGAWAAAKLGLITAEEDDDNWILNKSYNDLREMLLNGITPYFVFEAGDDELTTSIYTCNRVTNVEDETFNAFFVNVYSGNSDSAYVGIESYIFSSSSANASLILTFD